MDEAVTTTEFLIRLGLLAIAAACLIAEMLSLYRDGIAAIRCWFSLWTQTVINAYAN